jgi:hypothetical protein
MLTCKYNSNKNTHYEDAHESLCCLFFDIRILITPLVSSNSSSDLQRNYVNICKYVTQYRHTLLIVSTV